jgi:hypothetical protein
MNMTKEQRDQAKALGKAWARNNADFKDDEMMRFARSFAHFSGYKERVKSAFALQALESANEWFTNRPTAEE